MTDDIRARLMTAYVELFRQYQDYAITAGECHERNEELKQQAEDAGLSDEDRTVIMEEAGKAAKEGRGP